jgi:ubiquitin-protein ligase
MSNHEIFNYDSCQFKIIDPSDDTGYYTILSNDGKDHDWLDNLNTACIINNLDKKQVKKRIEKYLKKFGFKQSIIKKTFNKNTDKYILKSELEELSKTSQSPLIAEKSAKGLFKKNIVSDIIINEYIECMNWIEEEKNTNISLMNGNIFVWNIILNQFKNEKLNFNSDKLSKYNLNGIEFELCFHEEFYPNYPPVIKIITPKLKNSLNYRISNSKMVQLEYWTPARPIKYIINRIIDILENFGEVDLEALENEKHKNRDILEFEDCLIKFASYSDSIAEDDEIDTSENFIKFKDAVTKTNTNISLVSKEYWKKGTGYGHGGSAEWNINEYIESQRDKNDKLENIIRNIVDLLNNANKSRNFVDMINLLEKSLVIEHLKHNFKVSSTLEIHEKESIFNLYVSLLKSIAIPESIHLFASKTNSLYDILKDKQNEFQKSLKIDKDNEFASCFVDIFNKFISPNYTQYIQHLENQQDIHDQNDHSDQQNNQEDIRDIYKSKLQEFRFDTTSILSTNYRQDYKNMFDTEKSYNWKKCQKRLSHELPSLMEMDSLPINFDSSIFVRVDEDNPMIIRALITGPPNTPYDSGCLIFDIYTPAAYPEKAPLFWFMNHGGNRFNPNLYDDGKVCLSILGTYIGPRPDQSEKWNKLSTLLQVLVSIQAQILIDEPYFNEPGYESSINTDAGKKQSETYNHNIRLYAMKSTVRDLLVNPKLYPQFEDIITEHFKLKKNYILDTYQKWCDEAPDNMKEKYISVFDEVRDRITKL